MASKDRTHGNKTTSKQRAPKPAAENPGRVARQPTPQAVLIQRALLNPRSLTHPEVLQLQRTIGNRSVGRLLAAGGGRTPSQTVADSFVQRAATSADVSAGAIQKAAAEGVRTPSSKLPFVERIQRAFGSYDISYVLAHIGPEATASARAMNAQAYTTGDHIVFAGRPDLHTAAHEAAHVVQQRAGVQLSGGLGQPGDAHERQADAIADGVVRGEAVEGMLDRRPRGASPGTAQAVQRRVGIEYETWVEARYQDTYEHEKGADDKNMTGFIEQDEDMLDSGQGWKISSDNSKLEFVTEPPVEIDQLGNIVDHMLNAIDRLPPSLDAVTPLNAYIQGQTNKKYVLRPYKKRGLTGSPQGTIGIPFAKLFDFFDLLTRYQLEASQALIGEHQTKLKEMWEAWNEQPEGVAKEKDKEKLIVAREQVKGERKAGAGAIRQESAVAFQNIAGKVEDIVGEISKTDLTGASRAKLKGMLHFMGQYMMASVSHEEGYKKKAFTIMSRTSFNSMYEALGEQGKAQFSAAAQKLMQQLEMTDKTAFPGQVGGFEIKDWLDSIKNPVDIIIPDKNAQYGMREMKSDLMTAPGAIASKQGGYETDKSMGIMGLDDGLVVVELRSLKHFTRAGSFTTQSMRRLAHDLQTIFTQLG